VRAVSDKQAVPTHPRFEIQFPQNLALQPDHRLLAAKKKNPQSTILNVKIKTALGAKSGIWEVYQENWVAKLLSEQGKPES